MSAPAKKTEANIFLRMHPLRRILVSFIIASSVFYFIWKNNCGLLLSSTIFWDVFALSYLVICWIVFFTRKQEVIVRVANKDDGSRGFVLSSILITSLASMIAVALLMTSKSQEKGYEVLTLIIAVTGMILSWAMVHTLFTFHYAHMYYEDHKGDKSAELNFPGNKEPDYIDFAYFSFVIGMTFQVSDVEIPSRRIRRTVLAHSLLAFALNTFVVALTINLIAGLRS
ncbi:MAG: DUF1345 domain-containing protein [Ferruginibacter sp.]